MNALGKHILKGNSWTINWQSGYFIFQNHLNFLAKKQTFRKGSILASLNSEKQNETHYKHNFKQKLFIFGLPFVVLLIAMFIPEYRELARVDFDGSKMYFKNVYGITIIEPTLYADILEVSTEIRANHSKQIMVSTLRGDYISSHMVDEKTVNLVQTQVLNELHSHGVQPFSGQR